MRFPSCTVLLRLALGSSQLVLFAGLCLSVASAHAAPEPAPEKFDAAEADISQLQAEMSAGRLSSRELVAYFLARIDALDRKGPQLNSIIELNPEALSIAQRLDEERRDKGPRGPLHGIPILLKDNIDTADSMQTTAGSLALVGAPARRDAFIVQKLRAAGAVILGKTNLSEWAGIRSTRTSSGWSARGGQTRNPYALDRNPCGSSSGSAVAVAAGLAVAAVGTETEGSIVCPSSVNGIVGIKPTVGLASRSGIIPISPSQDTPGPMARSVADATILLSVLAGADPDDPATLSAKAARDLPAPSRTDLRGIRVGVARNLAGFHDGVDAVFEQALAQLRTRGAELVDPANLELDEGLFDDETIVLLYEFKDSLNRYLRTRPDAPQTLAELIRFNIREREREMVYFGQDLFLLAESKGSLQHPEYRSARARAAAAAGPKGIDLLLRKQRLDVIVAPTVGAAWMTDPVNGDHIVGVGSISGPAVAGYPHITVPMGFLHGLPLGISFIGSAWSEQRLIGIAHVFESASRARRAPKLNLH